MKVLVTGGLGLIGSACASLFLSKKWEVVIVDNDMRGNIFGKDGSTAKNRQEEFSSGKTPRIVSGDIRDKELMSKIIPEVDAIAHCAAQPSHPKSLEMPLDDFSINAFGTLQLLELGRQLNPKIPFAFLSSNKVYGDQPNNFKYKVWNKRFENTALKSFDETLSIDHCGHTPFGVSKVAADLYCQEYAHNYGLKTATFRGGCLTGKNSRAVEMHGYLPYIIKCILSGQKYTIYGGGHRVRDQIHSSDVAKAVFQFIDSPKKGKNGKYGQAYNLGGCRENSISIFETIDAVEAKTGKKAITAEGPERESDHIWWISDMSKFRSHYPGWKLTKGLDFIFGEIIDYYADALGIKNKIKPGEPDFFKSNFTDERFLA